MPLPEVFEVNPTKPSNLLAGFFFRYIYNMVESLVKSTSGGLNSSIKGIVLIICEVFSILF